MKQRATAEQQTEKRIANVPHRLAEVGVQRSQSVNQMACLCPESLRNAQKRVQADPLFTAFNLADVNRMQIGLFGQPFLAHPYGLAAVSDGLTQDFQLARTRHSSLRKQDRAKLNTPNMGLFLSCMFLQ
jgi:hypothetical protein